MFEIYKYKIARPIKQFYQICSFKTVPLTNMILGHSTATKDCMRSQSPDVNCERKMTKNRGKNPVIM